jgi:hypothetical protein
VERLVELVAHGGLPCVRRQLDPVHLLVDVHGRLRFAVPSIISNLEISIPLACSNERVINRANRDVMRFGLNVLEGLLSKRRDRPYQPGRSKHWIKIKNRQRPAKQRASEIEWR